MPIPSRVLNLAAADQLSGLCLPLSRSLSLRADERDRRERRSIPDKLSGRYLGAVHRSCSLTRSRCARGAHSVAARGCETRHARAVFAAFLAVPMSAGFGGSLQIAYPAVRASK